MTCLSLGLSWMLVVLMPPHPVIRSFPTEIACLTARAEIIDLYTINGWAWTRRP